MILYTVMPEEFVLSGLGLGVGDAVLWSSEGTLQPAPGQAERVAAGSSGPVRLLVEPNPAGGWRVSRLLSSDPRDYLNPSFAPGRPVPAPGE